MKKILLSTLIVVCSFGLYAQNGAWHLGQNYKYNSFYHIYTIKPLFQEWIYSKEYNRRYVAYPGVLLENQEAPAGTADDRIAFYKRIVECCLDGLNMEIGVFKIGSSKIDDIKTKYPIDSFTSYEEIKKNTLYRVDKIRQPEYYDGSFPKSYILDINDSDFLDRNSLRIYSIPILQIGDNEFKDIQLVFFKDTLISFVTSDDNMYEKIRIKYPGYLSPNPDGHGYISGSFFIDKKKWMYIFEFMVSAHDRKVLLKKRQEKENLLKSGF